MVMPIHYYCIFMPLMVLALADKYLARPGDTRATEKTDYMVVI